jgi:hypothetical protein
MRQLSYRAAKRMKTREQQLGLNNNSVSDRESRWFRFFNFFSTAKEAGGATA